MTPIKTHGKFTIADMEAAFDKVSDPEDWRGPIDAIVSGSEIDVTEAAVIFYTGSVPKVRMNIEVDPKTHLLMPDAGFRLRSVGYRNGPCGP